MSGDAVSDPQKNKEIVLEFLEAFRTFDPAGYEQYLTPNPT
jgi:hypothetical protein